MPELNKARAALDPGIPYLFMQEMEADPDGIPRKVDTIFLTNRECPFRCVMCDLWKHTLQGPTPARAIPRQIRHAFDRLPAGGEVLKLYNSGNFFDPKAIPPGDWREIAALCSGYGRVVVENHPRWCDERMLGFARLLDEGTRFEVAMGIETVHPEALRRLNKSMDGHDLARAAAFCRSHGIDARGFLLLHAPSFGMRELMDDQGAREWTLRGVETALNLGFGAVSLIPLRPELLAEGEGAAPSLEEVARTMREAGRRVRELGEASRMRLFVDLWDVERFSLGDGVGNREDMVAWLASMNLTQAWAS